MTICFGTENWQSISTSLSSHPAMRRFSAKCASLPREGGAKWDLDPFFLILSPPQFEIWNLVHFSRVCPPGSQFLQRQRCSALYPPSFGFFRPKPVLTPWQETYGLIFYQPPTPSFNPLHPLWRGFGLVSSKVVFKTYFPADCMRIPKYPKLLNRSHWETASPHAAAIHFDRDASGHDCKLNSKLKRRGSIACILSFVSCISASSVGCLWDVKRHWNHCGCFFFFSSIKE